MLLELREHAIILSRETRYQDVRAYDSGVGQGPGAPRWPRGWGEGREMLKQPFLSPETPVPLSKRVPGLGRQHSQPPFGMDNASILSRASV